MSTDSTTAQTATDYARGFAAGQARVRAQQDYARGFEAGERSMAAQLALDALDGAEARATAALAVAEDRLRELKAAG